MNYSEELAWKFNWRPHLFLLVLLGVLLLVGGNR